ncbi:uncharacterized protein N7484_000593 [Penicillium longicatenatum]|uniref:uncharacterized protein n=1 Tax=Penicillium longicatenatum TaxID=1561947 RepID=UPI0025475C54|nr:uncharacterized protein N7484_000593 [Penicillium longicatenatum]KAJ5661221.1 hypothetical protein N7484_000593 [Penicillium longicatenatum]
MSEKFTSRTQTDKLTHSMAMKTTDDVKDIAIDTPPSAETLNKIREYTVLDRKGEQHSFKSIYDGPDSERVLVVFIRHFFCGSCREFITALSKISPTSLQTLPTPTSIVIVGLGDPGLIDSYVRQTNCPFPIYTDPSMKLYTELELVVSKAMGPRPAYFRKNMACVVAESFFNWVKHAGTGLMFKGGKTGQNGGEFLFESAPGGDGGKVVSWFHRMGGARDHTSMEGLRGVLDPEGLVLGKP